MDLSCNYCVVCKWDPIASLLHEHLLFVRWVWFSPVKRAMPKATSSRHVQGANLSPALLVNNTGSMSDTKLWCPRYGRGTVRCAIICVHSDVEMCVELVCDIFGSSLQYTRW